MDAEKNINTTVQVVADDLVSGSIQLYESVVQPELEACGYGLKKHLTDSTFVDHDGGFFPVAYNYYKWESPEMGDFSWFVLQSTFRFASNIVACLAFPKNGLSPVLSMNLNLKLDAQTFSIILGFKGGNLDEFTLKYLERLNDYTESPIFVDTTHLDFRGVRSSYAITPAIVEKTIDKAGTHVLTWLQLSKQNNAASPTKGTNNEDHQKYKSDLLNLHDQQGTTYDDIFGHTWLFNLFKKQLL
jgi:hypothetical protein